MTDTPTVTRRPEFEEPILDRIDRGMTFDDIAAELGIQRRQIRRWRDAFEDFDRACKIARAMWADDNAVAAVKLADQVPRDRDAVAKARLQVDARLRVASKLCPDVWGEKVDHRIGGRDQEPVRIEHVFTWRQKSSS